MLIGCRIEPEFMSNPLAPRNGGSQENKIYWTQRKMLAAAD
jgi:hypothetical protein